MPRTRNLYPTEFREHVVALAKSGRTAEANSRFSACWSYLRRQEGLPSSLVRDTKAMIES